MSIRVKSSPLPPLPLRISPSHPTSTGHGTTKRFRVNSWPESTSQHEHRLAVKAQSVARSECWVPFGDGSKLPGA